MAEVWAAYSSYTDHEIGRIIDYLKERQVSMKHHHLVRGRQWYFGEGSPNGSVNENKLFNGWPDTLEENMKYIDKLGAGHLRTFPDRLGSGLLGTLQDVQAPFGVSRRYCRPLIISWPRASKARGELRHQYHHSVDIVPTLLEGCGPQNAGVQPRC